MKILIMMAMFAVGFAAPAQLLLTDTFDITVAGAQTDLNLNQVARQAGSTYGVTYTAFPSIAGSAAAQTYLTKDEAYDGAGVLMMRALHGIAFLSVKIERYSFAKLA